MKPTRTPRPRREPTVNASTARSTRRPATGPTHKARARRRSHR